jgi:hypothetical protein
MDFFSFVCFPIFVYKNVDLAFYLPVVMLWSSVLAALEIFFGRVAPSVSG